MGMIVCVPLSGGPSDSCFCPGIPVSQTSIWLANPSKEPSWPIFFSPPLERILFKSSYRIPGGNHLCTYLLVHLLLLLACEHLECRSIPIHLYIPGSGACVLNEEMNEWTDQSITFDLWLVVVVQLLSLVWLFATTWAATHQVSLSITISQNFLKLMSIELVMSFNNLNLYCPLFLLPSVFLSIRNFSNELA